MTTKQPAPAVLTFAGVDPSGGAGIQADIEATASQGCHACPVVTALTVQDTQDVKDVVGVEPTVVIEQARAVLEDVRVAAIKIGMVGSEDVAEAIHTVLRDYPDIPVILDPVLVAGGGTPLANNAIVDAMRTLLLPLATLLLPNSLEARALAPEADSLGACAMALLDRGCELVLVTGSHENTPEVVNTLYGNHRELERFRWKRLPGAYHGSGCTLAAATAGLLAQGVEPMSAVHQAQEYTWETLENAYRIGMGQLIPNRLFWAKSEK